MTVPSAPSRWLVPSSGLGDDPDVFPVLTGRQFVTLKTPTWSTDKKVSVSGLERRRALWSYPLWKFKLPFELLRDSAGTLELQRLVTFYNAHAGGYQSWFYCDPFDNTVTSQNIGTGDGTTTTFQLTRTTTIGGFTFTEPVRGAVSPITLTVAGVAKTAGTDYTVGAMGLVTFTAAPAASAAVVWSGTFFHLCRFDDDELDLQQFMQGYWSSGGINFSSVRQ